LARGRYSIEYRMTPPDLNEEGRFVLRGARHPILEWLFREESKRPSAGAEMVSTEPSREEKLASSIAEVSNEAGEQAGPTADEVPVQVTERDGSERLSPIVFLRGFDQPPVAAEEDHATPDGPAPGSKDVEDVEKLEDPAGPRPPLASERIPRTVTPIDVHLGLQFNLLVITGPNTGGKTVALKTVGLLSLMAQCGLHIPAHQGSQLSIVDDVLADIGDEQSLEQSLSTFSSHVRRITEIVGKATDRTLVLLDELGAGTDPAEGAALGRSILDELDSIGCRAMVTTHIGDLKTYAFSNARAENAAVEFDIETLRPLYRVHLGDIGRSNALQIARRLSLPTHLVDRAAAYLEKSRGVESPEWEIIQKLRKEAEQARQEAMAEKAEAQRSREALAIKLADLQSQTENDNRIADARARLQPGDRVVVPRFGYDRPGRVVSIDPRKKTASVAIGQMKWDVPIAELIPQIIKTPDAAGSGPTKPKRH
jgi:DNA mismatch repair protein MutS2